MPAGVILGLVQWLFALTWTIYVVFLPQLAAQVGIDRKWVLWLLLLDQALFVLMDFGLGVAADRVAAGMQRLSSWIVAITAVSCIAFLMLPQTASPALFLGLVVLWSVTSSALRAPPMVLIARYAPPAEASRLARVSLVGLGVAGACAPMLTASLRGVDPRLPFALASIGLLVAVAALRWCERSLGALPAKVEKAGADAEGANAILWGGALVLVVALLALGFQVHTSLNSAAGYQRLRGGVSMEVLMPLFWVAFGLAMAGGGALARKVGPARLLLGAIVLGVAALAAAYLAGQLGTLVAAQLAAGAAWALVLACVVPAAIASGRSGREGRNTGLLFSMLALAAMLRISMMATEWNKTTEAAQVLPWLPALLWAAGLLLGAFGLWRAARLAGPQGA